MESVVNLDKVVRAKIVEDLEDFGCCDLCILRYIGNSEPYVYREDEQTLKTKLQKIKAEKSNGSFQENGKLEERILVDGAGHRGKDGQTPEELSEPARKLLKKTPCTTCLGLLDISNGASDALLDQIATAVKEANIQAKSYTVNLTLPVAVQFRAHFVWYRLTEKFPQVYEFVTNMKPEGVSLKNAWKWLCTMNLRNKVDPDSDWITDGCLTINVAFKYEQNDTECAQLNRYCKKSNLGSSKADISRSNIDNLLKDTSIFEFKRKFGDAPPVATTELTLDSINCSHVPIFIAGRYNKYSRNVSQTPWIIDGKRFHDGSVEELIADQVLPLTQAKQEKFSASGREDVDVRMLGRGRPFLMEIIQPKRTLFTQQDISNIRDKINASTNLIKVRDLQLVDRKAAEKLKIGEEEKKKNYCALCLIPGVEITQEIIDKLNNTPVPLVLQQKTPIRVLHRRALMTRERSIYSIKAVPAKSKHLFKLYVKTQAGTYVKEFVHGDLGRTYPSVAEILGNNADIVSLDVESIDFPWPPLIDDE